MRLLVTRPEPDAGAQAAQLIALGHDVIFAPLARIEFLNPGELPLDGVQAIIVTSRNALRSAQRLPEFPSLLNIPLFAVGAATADLARELGFTLASEGPGTAAELEPEIIRECLPDAGPLLHLAGETLAWDLKGALEMKGFSVHQPVVYRSQAVESLPEAAIEAFRGASLDGVILMSPVAAKTYATLLQAHGLEKEAEKPLCFCLSRNVEAALQPLPGLHTRVAAAPAQDDLLALIGPEAAN